MKVVLTGGCGYIGSALAKQLVERDDVSQILIIDPVYKGNPKCRIEPEVKQSKKIRFLQDDLQSIDYLAQFDQYDIIFHLAASIGGVRYFHENPAEIINNNLCSTLALYERIVFDCNLEKWRAKSEIKKCPKVVIVSSSMVYEACDKYPHHESHQETYNNGPVPYSSYGFSKLATEKIAEAYEEQYGIPYIIIRPFNAVAPEKPEEAGVTHVIPDLIRKIHEGQGTEANPLQLIGDGTQVRCFTHVSDIADGIITAAFKESGWRCYNIASDQQWTILELAQLIWTRMGHEGRIVTKTGLKYNDDVQKRIPSVTRAAKFLGWEAKYKLEDKIDEIIKAIVAQI
jgi:UDP-glucose 4-epimerase